MFLERFSELHRAQIVFLNLIRLSRRLRGLPMTSEPPSTEELQHSLLRMVFLVQQQAFAAEINQIRRKLPCRRSFQCLAPFLDEDGILRVGGRLRRSCSVAFKHPALLPSRHRLTEMIIRKIHLQYLHAGISTCHAVILRHFWIFSARRRIRYIISKCLRCYRHQPVPFAPPMADLPPERIQPAKPFSVVGVDFGGPFLVTPSKHRGVKSLKAYLCLFICFTTKAVHLEVVSDLTADAFTAALRRFVARRGACATIFSDCGTNFIGANRILLDLARRSAAAASIQWRFNPPGASHFGGLWERSIRSAKHHLHRTIGDQMLTFEEFGTVLCQVEAVLNSRPICPVSTDPNDLRPLTPGHFLHLDAPAALPDEVFQEDQPHPINRWRLVQHLVADLWRRWHAEYLHTLQQRARWTKDGSLKPADVGTLVLLKDDLAPPFHWSLGRITRLFPDPDGISRVAEVRTAKTSLRRPLTKLWSIPVP